ncbi:hypothetical protein E5288_WYG018129 [Bos mutus]|uniref:Uncharacterized protein n=1 Tax=Bos mutus TaxID=72004 RepID=A0A6B0RI51_9CETA|nr:hypothetical protein [Bos mutus]
MGLLPLRQPGIPRPPPPFSRRRNPHLTVPASHLWPAEDYARRSGERVVEISEYPGTDSSLKSLKITIFSMRERERSSPAKSILDGARPTTRRE